MSRKVEIEWVTQEQADERGLVPYSFNGVSEFEFRAMDGSLYEYKVKCFKDPGYDPNRGSSSIMMRVPE